MSSARSKGHESPQRYKSLLHGVLPLRRSSHDHSDSEHAELSDARKVRAVDREERKERRFEEQIAFNRQLQLRRQRSRELAEKEETPEQRSSYGKLDLYAFLRQPFNTVLELDLLDEKVKANPAYFKEIENQSFIVRARIHVTREMGPHLAFMVLRDQKYTVQGVLHDHGEAAVSPHMLRWAMRIPTESIVVAQGVVRAPREPVTGSSVENLELWIKKLYLVSENEAKLPFSVYASENSAAQHSDEHPELDENHTSSSHDSEREHNAMPVITLRTRMMNRTLDLRTASAQAIFRVQSVICSTFRAYLTEHHFLEIHTPKLQGGASESGASVFQLNYFGRDAFLAQSPQLYKQMCIAADFKRVYEIGPVFRAENSNTNRHLTEYTGLDIEMEVNHYYDALTLIDAMLKHIFKTLKDKCDDDIEVVRRTHPSSDFVWLEQTPVLPFAEGVRMLREDGYREEDGSEPNEFEDLHTRSEIRLGELVKVRFGTDYYILDKFPTAVRPFYALPDPDDPRRTNSFDIFVRGQEICTGGQRIHDFHMLDDRLRELNIARNGLEAYLEGFREGAPPHAGCGIGLERLVMLFLNLEDVRLGSLYPRDPRSFATQEKQVLRHPEASTAPPPWRAAGHKATADTSSQSEDLQPLPMLIANYGDSSNTAWIDDRFTVWRSAANGAAVGYSKHRHYAFIVGNPLCDRSQYASVIDEFVHYIRKERHLKPVWLMVGEQVEEILGSRYGWCTLTCTADQRIMDVRRNSARHDPEVSRKVRHARKEGVTVQEVPLTQPVPEDLRKECDQRIQSWHSSRRGGQTHLTEVKPWADESHRAYFIARDGQGQVCCLVVLAQLSTENGYQVKWAMSFPGAPSGAIELTISQALDTIGSSRVTFGTAASPRVTAIHGLNGVAFQLLSTIYNNFVERMHLLRKGEFREKLGASNDPTYICYPKHGLSLLGVKDLIDFFQD